MLPVTANAAQFRGTSNNNNHNYHRQSRNNNNRDQQNWQQRSSSRHTRINKHTDIRVAVSYVARMDKAHAVVCSCQDCLRVRSWLRATTLHRLHHGNQGLSWRRHRLIIQTTGFSIVAWLTTLRQTWAISPCASRILEEKSYHRRRFDDSYLAYCFHLPYHPYSFLFFK